MTQTKCYVFEFLDEINEIPSHLNNFPNDNIQLNGKLGDIIWRGGYRDMDTLIIGLNGILIKNPNQYKDGYLTIPKCVYSHIPNYKRFYDVLEEEITFEK